MKNQNGLKQRIESVQMYFYEHPNSTFNDCLEAHPFLPKGTLSYTISAMKIMGHLIRDDKGRYSTPAVLCSSKQIAGDVSKYNKQREMDRDKNRLQQQNNASLFNLPESSSLQDQIEKAAKLLKTHGYKILKPTTEWREM
jgi:hypothetical protein